MAHFEEKLQSDEIYSGKIIKVRKDTVGLPNGRTSLREVVEHAGGVGIVAIDSENNIYVVRQYRYPFEQEIVEIPAGKLEKGEDHYECAVRELSEETGMTADEMIYLGCFYPSPGYCCETLHVYLAKGLHQGEMHLDEDEFLDVEKIPLDKFTDMIMDNTIKDAKTIIGVLKAVKFMDKK